MMSLRLWQAIQNSGGSEHPLFKRMTLMDLSPGKRLPVRLMTGASMVAGLMFICVISMLIPPYLIHNLALLPLLMPLFVVLLAIGGTGNGLGWAGNISAVIVHEHTSSTFDLLSTTPGGALGACWAIAMGCLHRNNDLSTRTSLQTQVAWGGFFMSGVIVFVIYLNTWTQAAARWPGNIALILFPLVAIYYIDYVQSVVMSVQVGLLGASYRQHIGEARVLSMGLFLSVQTLTYAIAGVIALWLLPLLGIGGIGLAGLRVIAFFGVRDLAILGLWRQLTHRLNAPGDSSISLS